MIGRDKSHIVPSPEKLFSQVARCTPRDTPVPFYTNAQNPERHFNAARQELPRDDLIWATRAKKRGFSKGVSAGSGVTCKKSENCQGYWAQQCIRHSERHSQERRKRCKTPLQKIPFSQFLRDTPVPFHTRTSLWPIFGMYPLLSAGFCVIILNFREACATFRLETINSVQTRCIAKGQAQKNPFSGDFLCFFFYLLWSACSLGIHKKS